MANNQTAQDKINALQKQIDALENQKESLNQEVVHEVKLKLSDARKVVQELEEQLARLTGKPAASEPRTRRARRASITDDALQDQVLKVMANFGKEGMNAKQLADRLNQDPIRVRKFIKDNPKLLKRQGAGPGTRLFLS